ncbi:aspartate aminotransferase family protein [Arthrobacter pigmenti]
MSGNTVDAPTAWSERYRSSLLGVFGTPQRVLAKGSGCTVWDADGNKYLDLLGGIAVNALGHAHPALTRAVSEQMNTLGHVSNFFTSAPQIQLAEKLLEISAAPAGSKVFFTNSGTEATEAAFKLARKHGHGTDRKRIIAMEGGFHGRTMGALALTAKEAYKTPFEPLPGPVSHIPFGDVQALEAAVDENVAAVIVEPIQGEAGVRELPEGYLRAAREITAKAGALLIIDEVQTGIGRTGSWMCSGSAANADAVIFAKGLGGGIPIGALITSGEGPSSLLSAGEHGTTFGGNPVATAAALATLETIESEGLLEHTAYLGGYLRAELASLEHVVQVRGEGLLIAFDVDTPAAAAIVTAALEAGFIVNAPGPSTIRLAPPLILGKDQADLFLTALPNIISTALEPHAGTAAKEKQ